MFNKFNFYLMLMYSILISISANSWLGCWIGLEINLLMFITIISNSNNLMKSEASLKYFLIQAISSMNLLFVILLNMMYFKMFMYNYMLSIMINITIFMKLSAAPFHFWFPNMMEGLSWMNCYILMTWQKITPMILLSYYYNFNFLIIISLISSIIGAIGGFNQTSLRKLMAYSSINHLSWMILSLLMSNNMWNLYFSIYFILMMMMCFMFYMLNSFYINQLFYFKMNFENKLFMMLNLLSLGGLPPLLGFLSKWIIIDFLINKNFYLMTTLLIMTTLITLYYYIQISYSIMLIFYLKLKWMNFFFKNNLFYLTNIISFISLNFLIMSSYFYFFM